MLNDYGRVGFVSRSEITAIGRNGGGTALYDYGRVEQHNIIKRTCTQCVCVGARDWVKFTDFTSLENIAARRKFQV